MALALGLGLGLTFGGTGAGPYEFTNQEAADLVARFSVEPDDARKALIDNMVGTLKTAGVWSALDGLYILAAHDAQAARRNWIADAYNLTPVASPTFTVDRGYAGDGVSSYLDTGFTPSTAPSPQYQAASAMLGVATDDNVTVNGTDIGGRTAANNKEAQHTIRNSAGTSGFSRLNGTGTNNDYSVPTPVAGRYVSRRTGTALSAHKETTLLHSVTSTVGSAPAVSIWVGALNNNGSVSSPCARRHNYALIGGYIDDTALAAMDAALATYLAAVGA